MRPKKLKSSKNSSIAKTVFYAAYVNKTPYVFNDWESCRSYVNGVPHAKFKKFQTKKEAEAFLENITRHSFLSKSAKHKEMQHEKEHTELLHKADSLTLYTDGSFKDGYPKAGWAWAICQSRGLLIKKDSGTTPSPSKGRNVDGEMHALLAGLRWLAKEKYTKNVLIIFDYAGLEHFAKGDWKAKAAASKLYVQAIQELEKKFLSLRFQKVSSHFNNQWNDFVDRLAKEAISN